MPSSARDVYLETEVMTAAPQKRQLMLIEAAIRSIERARQGWRADNAEDAHECLVRAQRIVTEMMAALNHEVVPDLTRRVASLYVFVFRRLVEANLRRDESKLDDALRVLDLQRQTWQDMCERLGVFEADRSDPSPLPKAAYSSPQSPLCDSLDSAQERPGLSIEA
jgi:flagellar protein FliS